MSDMAEAVAAQRAKDGAFWYALRVWGITAAKGEDGIRYWQTGALVNSVARAWPLAGRAMRALCRMRGHHWSRTEWGWDGGGTLDVWCRWCGAHGAIPMREMPDTHQKAFDLWDTVENDPR